MKRRDLALTSALPMALLLITSTACEEDMVKTELSDKSATISLAPGWKLVGGSAGAITAVGPNDASINLGVPTPVVTRGVENLYPIIPAAYLFPGTKRVDFTDPVRAALDMAAQVLPEQRGKVSRVLAVEYIPWDNGRAAFMRGSNVIKDVRYEWFALVAIMPVDNVSGIYYCSMISAPSADFPRQYPVMMAMWRSWSLNKGTVAQRLEGAAKALGEIDVAGAVDSVVRERRAAGERAAAKFDAYLKQ